MRGLQGFRRRWDSLTPEQVNFTATLQTHSHKPFLPPWEVRGAQIQSTHFQLWQGSLFLHCINCAYGLRNERPPSPPSPLQLSFPFVPSTSPLLSLSVVIPLLHFPLLTHSERGKAGSIPYPQNDSQWEKERASGRVFLHPPPPAGFVSYLPSSQGFSCRARLASAQAHPVSSKKATAFPSPRRPREQ